MFQSGCGVEPGWGPLRPLRGHLPLKGEDSGWTPHPEGGGPWGATFLWWGYSLPRQMTERVPVQQQSPGTKGRSDELPQANFWLQYWQMGQEPEG